MLLKFGKINVKKIKIKRINNLWHFINNYENGLFAIKIGQCIGTFIERKESGADIKYILLISGSFPCIVYPTVKVTARPINNHINIFANNLLDCNKLITSL